MPGQAGRFDRHPTSRNRAGTHRPPEGTGLMAAGIDLTPYFAALSRVNPTLWMGEVTELIGLLVESLGPAAAVGDFCEIQTQSGRGIRTQVIGFRDGHVLSMPLEETDGLQLGDLIVARSDEARVAVGPGLLGRVLDGRSEEHTSELRSLRHLV